MGLMPSSTAAAATTTTAAAVAAAETAGEYAWHLFLPLAGEVVEIVGECQHRITLEGGSPAGGYAVERYGFTD